VDSDYDVIIVGGGAAGLSAALILARARRTVLICDEGNRRNRFAKTMHGFITRDGISPADWVAAATDDLSAYSNVHMRQCRVNDVQRFDDGFEVRFEKACDPMRSRKLLLATGVIDTLPSIPGIESFFGKSVFHCPYCDGFELAGMRLAAYGNGENGRQMALELLGWSDRIVLLTDGAASLDERASDELRKCDIRVIETRIKQLRGSDGHLELVQFENGEHLPCDAMFFKSDFFEKSHLAEKLGCNLDDKGLYATEKFESTNIPGLFVAGDASKHLHLVIEASASGAEAAFAINTQLLREQIKARMHSATNEQRARRTA
jgi:thioredoxin reductase